MKRKCFAVLLALGICLSAAPLFAAGPIVIVFDIEDKGWGLKDQVLSNLTDYLSVRLTKGGFQVIPPSQIRERLASSKQESHKTCYDQGCQIELGRELAAQKTISTQVFRIADVCQVTSTMYDLKKSIAEKAAFSEKACDERSLLEAIKEISNELSQLNADDSGAGSSAGAPAGPPSEADRKAAQELAARVIAEEMEYFEKEAKVADKKASAEKKRKQQEREKFGTLVVLAKPQTAQVVLDGKSLGHPPINQKVPVGRHELKVHSAGYRGHVQDVTVDGGRKNEVKVALRKLQIGKLAIKTQPAKAMVYINDKEAGPSPVTKTVPAGSFTVAAELSGYDAAEKSVRVTTDKSTEVTLVLKKELPANPFKTWGHVAFWSGLVLAGGGAAALLPVSAAVEDYKSGDLQQRNDAEAAHSMWSTISYAGLGVGGALLVGGIVLWVLSPGDEAWAGQQALVPGVTPDGRGVGFTLSGSW